MTSKDLGNRVAAPEGVLVLQLDSLPPHVFADSTERGCVIFFAGRGEGGDGRGLLRGCDPPTDGHDGVMGYEV